MQWTIRTPTAAEQPAAAALLQTVWGTELTVHRLGDRYDLLRLPRLIAVTDSGDVVGTAGWAPLPPEFADAADGEWILDLTDPEPPLMRGLLVDVAVAAAQRRQGIGRALLAGVLQQMRQTGLTEVLASVDPSNAAGLQFLQQLGFAPAADNGAVAGPWPAEVVLTRAV